MKLSDHDPASHALSSRVTELRKKHKLTLDQLEKWDLKFHKLLMGKPSYDVIIDDKAFGFSSNWYKKL